MALELSICFAIRLIFLRFAWALAWVSMGLKGIQRGSPSANCKQHFRDGWRTRWAWTRQNRNRKDIAWNQSRTGYSLKIFSHWHLSQSPRNRKAQKRLLAISFLLRPDITPKLSGSPQSYQGTYHSPNNALFWIFPHIARANWEQVPRIRPQAPSVLKGTAVSISWWQPKSGQHWGH